MAPKITSYRLIIQYFKAALLVVMLCSSLGAFSQIIVESVEPRIVTTNSRVTIKGAPGQIPKGIDSLTCGPIYKFPPSRNNFKANSGPRTFIEIIITRDSLGMINDVGGTPLMINNQTVHTGFPASSTNQVFLSYVAPKVESLTNDKSFFVKEIYTNWNYKNNGFWNSSAYKDAKGDEEENAAAPNNKHQLLGYKINKGGTDIIYSTGVNDSLLEKKLNLIPGANYERKVFKAYSTNGVRGNTSSDNFIIAGDMVDGVEENESPEDWESSSGIQKHIKGLTILEAITTGKQGLELGIGVTNFKSSSNVNSPSDIKFFSGNGEAGAVDDGDTPDLLITQIADAQGYSDVYYYSDPTGNVVGRPIRLRISDIPSTELAKWKVNLYSFENDVPFGLATPKGRGKEYLDNKFRPLRMAAFEMKDFEITTAMQVDSIETITMIPGGQADIAFMAYNEDSFNLKGPVAKTILPQFICRVDGSVSSKATFRIDEGINVGIEDYDAEGRIRKPNNTNEYFSYILTKDGLPVTTEGNTSSSLTVSKVDLNDLGIYKLSIKNKQGTVIVPVELAEGGTPFFRKEGEWKSFYRTGLPDQNSSLIFEEDYTVTEYMEACDCRIVAGNKLTIPKEQTLKLYNNLVVDEKTFILDENGDKTGEFTEAAIFTLENSASLIQIKDVEKNQNRGNIIVKRDATTKHDYDYVYWSSPVEDGNLSMIPEVTSHVYEWDVNFENNHNNVITYGNWVKPNPANNGVMETGRGYIKRVNAATVIYSSFEGVPNNGVITFNAKKTEAATSMSNSNHMNLIGNPYPSAISAETFLKNNSALEGYVQIWDHTESIYDGEGKADPFYGDFKYNYGDQYLTFNLTGESPQNPNRSFEGHIASGQGFFVQVRDEASSAPEVTFNNKMRYEEGKPNYDNSNFYRPSGISADAVDTEKQLIWLSLVNENSMSAVTLLGYADGATNGKDRLYDAGSGSGDMRIYSRIDDEDFLIQGRALPFRENDEVPLGIEVLKNGIYNIGIDHLKGSLLLDEEQGIYLEDTYNNVVHNLRTAPYGFTATQGDIKDRFVLRYTNEQLQVDDHQVEETFVYVKNGHLYAKAPKNIESIVVYDLTGKKVLDYKLDGKSDRFSAPFPFSRGAYLTNIILENSGKIVIKKLIN